MQSIISENCKKKTYAIVFFLISFEASLFFDIILLACASIAKMNLGAFSVLFKTFNVFMFVCDSNG